MDETPFLPYRYERLGHAEMLRRALAFYERMNRRRSMRAFSSEPVFALYLGEHKIEPEVVENTRTWQHSGFSVDQSVFLPAGDQVGIERPVQTMTQSRP